MSQAIFRDLLRTFAFPCPGQETELAIHWLRASTVYLGFAEAADGHSRRLYFEYWEEVDHRLGAIRGDGSRPSEPLPQGVGYKWTPYIAESLRRTDYLRLSGLRHDEVLEFFRRSLISHEPGSMLVQMHSAPDTGSHAVNANQCESYNSLIWLIAQILERAPRVSPVLLKAHETVGRRMSLDLCLHQYGIGMHELRDPTVAIVRGLLPAAEQERLQQLWPDGNLATHLSAGRGADGKPYVCLYSQQDN